MDSKTQIRVWYSADGYRDPDDNLSMLVGGAQIRTVAASNGRVSVGGFVYGDTKDGGQYYMLHPTGKAPGSFGSDSRYGDTAGNKVAAGNYAFYKQYGKAGLGDLGSGWKQFDLLASDNGGQRAWNFHATSKTAISAASSALASDIISAIGKGNAVVVYSAGGGANVPAEAIGYLRNHGYSEAAISSHFAVIQHGRSNWGANYESEARSITRDYTIAISNQNMATYDNGMDGPNLKTAITNKSAINGAAFGTHFDKALDVAIGTKAFGSLSGATFKTTVDASDAGSHAFAVDLGSLQSAWNNKMHSGDDLPTGDAWAHRISGASGARLRVIYNEFDAKDVAQLLNGRSATASAGAASASPAETAPTAPAADPTTSPTTAPTTAPATAHTTAPATDKHAPFLTSDASLTLDKVSLHGLGLDGKVAEIVSSGGKIGVAGSGDANTIDHHGASSEAIGFDFGGEADEITFNLSGLSSKAGASEAAMLTVYDADGDKLDSYLYKANGTHTVDVDDHAHYATLEAADWVVSSGGAPSGEPDFALVSFHLDYV
jgi:hypothetical protein